MRLLKPGWLGLLMVVAVTSSMAVSSWAGVSKQALQPALQLYRQGQYQQALQQFKQLAHAHKEDGRPVYYQALCLVQLGRLQEAQKRYQQVTLLYPNTEMALAAQKGLKLLASSGGVTGSVLDPPPAPPAALARYPGSNSARSNTTGSVAVAPAFAFHPLNSTPLAEPNASPAATQNAGFTLFQQQASPSQLSSSASSFTTGASIRPSDVGLAPSATSSLPSTYGPPPSPVAPTTAYGANVNPYNNPPYTMPYTMPQGGAYSQFPQGAQQGAQQGEPQGAMAYPVQTQAPFQPPWILPASGTVAAYPPQPNPMMNPMAMNPMMNNPAMMMMNLMGNGGGNDNGNAMGWMMPMMMQGGGMPGVEGNPDPEVMKQLMMNSVMGKMDFGMSGSNKNE
jgi:Tetratricopeptide repeat